jgi:hypothetical protein
MNQRWKNDGGESQRESSFRGYADYMQTPEFDKSIEKLIQLANHDRIALMCAEAVPWRCHRSLIADALLVRGILTRRHHEANSAPGFIRSRLLPEPDAPRSHIRANTCRELRRSRRLNALDRSPSRQPHGDGDLSLANQRRIVLEQTSNCGPEQRSVNQMILSWPILTASSGRCPSSHPRLSGTAPDWSAGPDFRDRCPPWSAPLLQTVFG